MIKNGMIVYYLVNGYVMEGQVMNVMNVMNEQENQTFEIEGVGGCGGAHILSTSQLHHTVFISKEEAEKWSSYEGAYLISQC